MTALTIRRLGAEVPADDEQASLARVDRLLRLVADRALDERWAAYAALSGEWYVRRLELQLDLAVDEPDASAAARWAALIADTIRDLVADGDNVLHFSSRSRLLLDLVVGLAVGNLSRSWVWRQAALLTPTDPDPTDRPSAALIAAFGCEPRLALPVLVRAAQQVGVRALHATFGPVGWSGLADLVRPGWRVLASRAAGARIARPGLEQRAAAVLADSALARAVRAEGVVPDDVTRSAWAVLVLAESDPAGPADLLPWITVGLDHRAARQPPPSESERVADAVDAIVRPAPAPMLRGGDPEPARTHLAAELSEHAAADLDSTRGSGSPDGLLRTGERLPLRTPPGHADVPAASAPTRPAERNDSPDTSAASVLAASADDPRAEVRTVPPDAEAEPGVPTNWAGLLFLLNAAPAAGLPDALETDVRLARQPLRWVVHQLTLRMVPVRPDDPAALALAGLSPAAPVPTGAPAEPAEETALDEHAARWAAAVALRLERARHPEDDAPVPTLWSLARRQGWIVADPGWLEVLLNLDEVDLPVRRAGLDVDPGWLDWLGTVVVFRYV